MSAADTTTPPRGFDFTKDYLTVDLLYVIGWKWVSRKFLMQHWEDLVQEYVIGGWRAMKKADVSKDVHMYNQYIRIRAQGAVIDFIRKATHMRRGHYGQGNPKFQRLPENYDRWLQFHYDKSEYEDQEDVEIYFRCMGKRHAEVMRKWVLEEKTLKEIGQELCLSESRVCQLARQGRERVMHFIEQGRAHVKY